MMRSPITRLLHETVHFLLGLIALALLTALCFWLDFRLVSTAFTSLILIVLLSLADGFIPLVTLSFIAVVCLNYFFAPPIFSFHIEYQEDIVTISAFLITSLTVTSLVRRTRAARDELANVVDGVAGDKAAFDRVVAAREDDRDCTGRPHGDERRIVASGRGDHGHLTSNEIGRERRQPIQLSLRPAIFDRDVLTLDVTDFVQATAERDHIGSVRLSGLSIQESDHGHRRLLPENDERPSSHRTAEQRDELTPLELTQLHPLPQAKVTA